LTVFSIVITIYRTFKINNIRIKNQRDATLGSVVLLTTASTLYMFRTLSASVIRSTKNCSSSHWCVSWVRMMYIQ